jgi:hypothetical protein
VAQSRVRRGPSQGRGVAQSRVRRESIKGAAWLNQGCGVSKSRVRLGFKDAM